MTAEKARNKVIFHVDLDAFYASVEQIDNPELKGKPVIVGALPGQRGVVSACSYEARVFGIHSAMPISEAYRRCRHGIYLTPRMRRYQEISRTVMKILKDYTPEIHQISVDEATLDMTGTERLFGDPIDVADRMKRQVREETGLSISIGIATNRYIAKLASEFGKPDGLHRVHISEVEEFLDQLELKDLWGLGKRMLQKLESLKIKSIPQLREYTEMNLQALVGKAAGSYLYRVVRGAGLEMYSEHPKSRSISSETTFGKDTKDRGIIERVLLDISHQIMFRLLDEGFRSKTVNLKLRYEDFTTTTAQATIHSYVSSAEQIYELALQLLEKRWSGKELIRLIGIGLSSLEKTNESAQGILFEDQYERKKKVEEAVLAIKKKHKSETVVKASLLGSKRRRWEEDPNRSQD